jgi:carboxypeptidase PM20D1
MGVIVLQFAQSGYEEGGLMELWVIVLSILLIAILALIAVLVIRTLTFKSKQLTVTEKISYEVNGAEAAGRLAEAIRFKTVSNIDRSLVDYSTFKGLHEFLQRSFPLVNSSLEKKVINGYGFLYYWKGSDSGKKPVLLLAHQDVVPASDEGWKYPPFSGAIEEGYIWGRGTLDDKGCLLAIMEALEFLLKAGYQPSRSIYLASGFDEEVGGHEGAGKIAEYLKTQGVQFEYILDEGMLATRGVAPGIAGWTALVGVAEKGYISLELSAEQKGGHAAAPPPQTTVGILAAAIVKLQDNPFTMRMTGPSAGLFEYLGPEMKFPNKMIFANIWLFGSLIKKRMAATAAAASLRTTTAPTMFKGSPQDNVLPTRAIAVINFRILQGDTIQSVINRVTRIINDPRVKISPLVGNLFEPSPVSPLDSRAYGIINRTIREVMGDALVTPTLVQGRTDSIYYIDLAECCYRFVPARVPVEEISAPHGFNERVSVNNYTEMINFYIRLLHNSCD